MYRPRNPFDGEGLNKDDHLEPLIPFQKTLKLSLSTLKINEVSERSSTSSLNKDEIFSNSRSLKLSPSDVSDADKIRLKNLRHRREVIDNEINLMKKVVELQQQTLTRTMLK